MQMRKIVTLAFLAVALAIPGVSLAKKDQDKDKHGIGRGGVPALRDALLGEIHDLEGAVDEAKARLDALESQMDALESQFTDADGDGSFVLVPDCDDANDAVSPDADEIPGNGLDDDCDPTTLD